MLQFGHQTAEEQEEYTRQEYLRQAAEEEYQNRESQRRW